MKEAIDIEDLLIWAYRDQCVDKQLKKLIPRMPSSSPQSILGRFMELGVRVDGANAALQAMGIQLPDDAVIVHDTILAMGNMWIEWEDDALRIWDKERAAHEGQVIERVLGEWVRRPAYMQDDTVPPILLRETCVVSSLILHARGGVRPDYYAIESENGSKDRWGRKRKAAQSVCDFDAMMFERGQYLAWHTALQQLALCLQGNLQTFDVGGPRAPQCPWVAEQ